MGKINASKSQKEEAIVEQSEEGQVEQETEDNTNPLYSDVVSNGSSLNSGTSISISGNSTTSGLHTFWEVYL
jgi:CTP-dependent riboflavin kinase